MPTLYIPIGLPGCGKGTYYTYFLAKKGVERVSFDDIRFRILDTAHTKISFDPGIEEDVKREAFLALTSFFQSGRSVYFDATNLTLQKRMDIIKALIQSNTSYLYFIEYIYFELSLDDVMMLQEKRERKVERDIVRNMSEIMELSYIETRVFYAKTTWMHLSHVKAMLESVYS